MRRLGRARDVVHRPDGVRRPADGHELRPLARRGDRSSSTLQVQSAGSKSSQRTVAPRSAAARSQGETFASWSRRVRTTSSPGFQSRERLRAIWNVSVVMFGPKAISSGRAAPRKSATADRASATTSSEARLVGKGPAVVRVRLVEVPDDPVGHLAGDLRAARVVEDHVAGGEGGETGADRFEVEHPERLARSGQERFLSFASLSRRARSSSSRRFMSASRPAPFGA